MKAFASSLLFERQADVALGQVALHNVVDVRLAHSKDEAVGAAIAKAMDSRPGLKLISVETVEVTAEVIDAMRDHTG